MKLVVDRLLRAQWQYQPSLSAHDPSPPITLDGVPQAIAGSLLSNTTTFFDSAVVKEPTTRAIWDEGVWDDALWDVVAIPQAITGTLVTNTPAFYTAAVTTSVAITGALFTNVQAFYAASVSATVGIAGTLYTDPDTFFGAVISAGSGPQAIVGGLAANDNVFFGATVAREDIEPAPVVRRHGVSPAYAKKAEANREEFERNQRERELALRASIERAFAQAEGEADISAPGVPVERAEMVRSIQADINLDGFDASLREIGRLLDAYEQELRVLRERQLEEEAIIMLLLVA